MGKTKVEKKKKVEKLPKILHKVKKGVVADKLLNKSKKYLKRNDALKKRGVAQVE
jgi:hypothetical protein